MYVNITRCRGKKKNIHISIITHNSLFCSKIESGNLYLKNYYSKIDFEIWKPPQKRHFFCVNHVYKKHRPKMKKKIVTELRVNFFCKKKSIRSFLSQKNRAKSGPWRPLFSYSEIVENSRYSPILTPTSISQGAQPNINKIDFILTWPTL